jgi:hypothetical protein
MLLTSREKVRALQQLSDCPEKAERLRFKNTEAVSHRCWFEGSPVQIVSQSQPVSTGNLQDFVFAIREKGTPLNG